MLQLRKILFVMDPEPVVFWLVIPWSIIYGVLLVISPPESPVYKALPMPWFGIEQVIGGLVGLFGLASARKVVTLFGIAVSGITMGYASILVWQQVPNAGIVISLFVPIVIAAAWAFLRLWTDPIRIKWALEPDIKAARRFRGILRGLQLWSS